MSIARKIITGDAGDPSDPDFANVSLLLNGDGNNGANNNTFADSSSNNFAVNSSGDVYQGSVSPYGDHWSTYFDGSRSDLQIEGSGFSFGTGRFTIEAWLWRDDYASGGNEAIVSGNSGTNSSSTTFSFHVSTSGYLEFGAGTTYVSSSSVIDLGVWNHVAAVYNGSKIKLFINGVQKHSSSKDYSFSFNRFKVCTTRSNSRESKCYLSNLRILKGTALYTSAFTPPTSPLTAITNTKLLICNSNSLNDESANENAVSIGGDPKVTPFSPYATSEPLDMTTDGGSGYFAGSRPYVSLPNNTAYSPEGGNFTLEAWVYPETTNVVRAIWSKYTSGNQEVFFALTDSNKLTLTVGKSTDSGSTIVTTYTLQPNKWWHVAAVRNGSNLYLYVNGTQRASGAYTRSVPNGSNDVYIGDYQLAGYYPFEGYISDVRWVKGTAVYTGNFTPPTSPLTATPNTKALLNFQDAGIYDLSGTSDIFTAGTAQVSTSVKKYGTGSIDFSANNSELQILETNGSLTFGTGDFTVETWAYLTSVSGTTVLIDWRGDIGPQGLRPTFYTSSGRLRFYNGDTRIETNSLTNRLNQWLHLALVRSSGQTKLYIDGTKEGNTYTDSNNYLGTQDGTLYVGGLNGNYSTSGYMDDLRITKGVARYTANFTPPTAALPTY